jgi:hypothetical protein
MPKGCEEMNDQQIKYGMKVSDLIKDLTTKLDIYGDVEVVVSDNPSDTQLPGINGYQIRDIFALSAKYGEDEFDIDVDHYEFRLARVNVDPDKIVIFPRTKIN